jgi:soluble epoxide hydrolase/lipid-phosphate phosphatase
MLGYGGTDKPASAESYSSKHLCADLAALLDYVGVQRAVVVGHDWGAAIVWRFGMYHPERVLAMVT